MTTAIASAEELFRFASIRAPSPTPKQPGLLDLLNDTDVPAWLAAPLPDFAVQLDTLSARWAALAERSSDAIAADLHAARRQGDPDAVAIFPIVDAIENAVALDTLQTALWRYFLQGVASGAASTGQLRRARQLMGQVNLLQTLAVSGAGALDQGAIDAALHPLIRLPAAFEQQLQLRRTARLAARSAENERKRIDEDDALAVLARSLDTLGTLEQRLLAAVNEPVDGANTPPSGPDASGSLEKSIHVQAAADPARVFRLQNETLFQQLAEAGLATAALNPFQLLDAVRRKISSAVLTASRTPLHGPAVPALLAAHPVLRSAATAAGAPTAAPVQFGIRALGVADLRVVRQTLVGYEQGELAHIANVLQGEEVEQFHFTLQREEQSDFEYSETLTETTREASGSARYEFGQFAWESAHQQQDRYSSVNLSGQYGDVYVNLSDTVGESRSEDRSRSEDVRLAEEVINRALNTAREVVGRQRFRTLTSEVQDSITRRQTAEEANVIGQYRWVDKVYQAQLYNYGARAMYEVMVPRPAAMFTHLLAQQPGYDGHAGPAPVKPQLQPADITDATWACYAERFGVNLPPPPPSAITEFAQASYPSKCARGAVVAGVFKAAEALQQGYLAARAGCSLSWYGVSGQAGVTASIGTAQFVSGESGADIAAQAIGAETGAVSYTASGWGALDQFTVNLYLVWTRSQRALEQWQLACHRLILQRYESDLAAHRERLAVARGKDAGAHAQLTALQMRQIERTELKRAVLEIVRNGTGQVAAPSPIGLDGIPVIRPDRLEAAAREVRFFEHVFEWEQMTYRFHPYFWSESADQWGAAKFDQQGDKVFTAFLNAGFASLVLPVRSGCEDAAALYLQTGLLLDLPLAPADDSLASLNRDVQLRNRALPVEGVAEGEAWIYRVPTTMMIVEEGSSGPLMTL